MSFLVDNPILWRELISRWRSRDGKSTAVTTLIVVTGAVAAIYLLALRNLKSDHSVNGARDEFSLTVILLSLAIWLLTPALVANAISHEREQGCWSLLQASLLAPSEVVVGKLIGRTAPIVGILLLTVPILVMCSTAGLIPVGTVTGTIGVMMLWIATLAAVSLLVSTCTSRSAVSIGVAYMFPAMLILITTVTMALTALMGIPQVDSVTFLNPFSMLGVITQFGGDGGVFVQFARTYASIAILVLLAVSALAMAMARLRAEWRL